MEIELDEYLCRVQRARDIRAAVCFTILIATGLLTSCLIDRNHIGWGIAAFFCGITPIFTILSTNIYLHGL